MPEDRSDHLCQLLGRVALGDQLAMRQLYERTSAHLFGLALRLLNRRHLAEEVLQESFVSVWHNAGNYDSSQGQPMTWLISIVRHKALDLVRSATVRRETGMPTDDDGRDLDIVDEDADPLTLFTTAIESRAVRQCLDGLDANHRQSLALAYYHGLSHSQVAEQMAAPIGSVKSWVRRGLDRLKKCLEGGG